MLKKQKKIYLLNFFLVLAHNKMKVNYFVKFSVKLYLNGRISYMKKTAIILMILILSFSLFACGNNGSDTVKNNQDSQSQNDSVKEDMKDTAEDVKDNVKDTAKDVKDGAKDTADNMKDAAEDVADGVKNGVDEMKGNDTNKTNN